MRFGDGGGDRTFHSRSAPRVLTECRPPPWRRREARLRGHDGDGQYLRRDDRRGSV